MTESERLSLLRKLYDGPEADEVLTAYLGIAGDAIIKRAYPFDDSRDRVPERYSLLQVQIASALLYKRGAEGELSHSENGVSRTYADDGVPESLLSQVMPFVKVPE